MEPLAQDAETSREARVAATPFSSATVNSPQPPALGGFPLFLLGLVSGHIVKGSVAAGAEADNRAG